MSFVANKHLIFSRNANGSALSNDQIMQLAPAVFSKSKAENLTERYVSLHTSDLIPVMQDYGYVPVQAAQKASRKSKDVTDVTAKGDHNAHLIAFAKPAELGNELALLGARPEIILYNSHDGTGSVKLFAGCFRFICSNGIIAGEGFNSRMYHSKSGLLGFEDMLKQTVESLPFMQEKIHLLSNTQLDSEQAYAMAKAGVNARWELLENRKDFSEDSEEFGTFATDNTIRAALAAVRMEDRKQDAFTVFNRIQEAVIRGKAYVKSYTAKNPTGTVRKARPVNSVKENIRLNTELWDIADSFAA